MMTTFVDYFLGYDDTAPTCHNQEDFYAQVLIGDDLPFLFNNGMPFLFNKDKTETNELKCYEDVEDGYLLQLNDIPDLGFAYDTLPSIPFDVPKYQPPVFKEEERIALRNIVDDVMADHKRKTAAKHKKFRTRAKKHNLRSRAFASNNEFKVPLKPVKKTNVPKKTSPVKTSIAYCSIMNTSGGDPTKLKKMHMNELAKQPTRCKHFDLAPHSCTLGLCYTCCSTKGIACMWHEMCGKWTMPK